MKRFSEQLQNKANTVRMSAAEKEELRERLVSYMEYHPLPLPMKDTSTVGGRAIVAPVQLVHVNAWKLFQWTTAAIGVFLLSVTYLAERSVPGDSLYAVKVRFNEEVRSTLARGSYEKVVWETERLNRRIAEARLLASEGRLTEAVEAGVAEAVRTHSENARREIEVLKQVDKEEAVLAALQLETTIEVQATAMAKEEHAAVAEATDVTGSQSAIIEALRDSQNDDAIVPEQVAADLPSYERLTAHVERETTRAYELLQSVKKNATTAEKSDIERRLEDIERSIEEAVALVETGEIEARQKLITVLQRTQRLIVFMTNIDVRHVVTVEEIVPVTLTIEERNALVKSQAEEIIAIAAAAKPLLEATTTDPALVDKLAPALAESVATASSALATVPLIGEELSAIETAILSAVAIARDTAIALGVSVDSDNSVLLPEVREVEQVATTSTATTTSVVTDTQEAGEGAVVEEGETEVGTSTGETIPESSI